MCVSRKAGHDFKSNGCKDLKYRSGFLDFLNNFFRNFNFVSTLVKPTIKTIFSTFHLHFVFYILISLYVLNYLKIIICTINPNQVTCRKCLSIRFSDFLIIYLQCLVFLLSPLITSS